LASTEGPFIAISSPHARKGTLWQTYRDHFAREADPILVAQAETRLMNPRISERWLARQFALDPAKSAAEYGVSFRADLEMLFTVENVAACTDTARQRPPQHGIVYTAFCDPSGGAGDGFALALAHLHGKQAVLDLLDEVAGRLNPLAIVARFAETLTRYGCFSIYGDAFTANWIVSAFAEHGIEYRLPTKPESEAKMDRSQIYLELLPMVNSRQCVLLNNDRLQRQLCLLERSVTGASGREKVDHPRGMHDDLANAAAGVLVMTMRRGVLTPAYRLQSEAVDSDYDTMTNYDSGGRAYADAGRRFRFSGWAPTLHEDEHLQAYGITEERQL
jgi:hypothetical protein